MPQVEIRIEDYSADILAALKEQALLGMQAIGQEAEGFAKDNLTTFPRVDTGRLRNSVSHSVDDGETAVYIGTNVEYAPYVEYGTGKYADNGQGRQSPWMYQDAKGQWHWTSGMKPSHVLRDAAADHVDRYKAILEAALKA